MEIRNILTFLKVAGTQNFSKAAEQLGYSQSAGPFRYSSWKKSWEHSCLSGLESVYI